MTEDVHREHSLNRIRFNGACEYLEEDGELVLEIYSSFEDAVRRGVSPEAAGVIFAALGGAPGACMNSPAAAPGTHDCKSISCTGTCHVFSLAKGPVGPGSVPTDEGIGPVPRVAGRFYWCSCT